MIRFYVGIAVAVGCAIVFFKRLSSLYEMLLKMIADNTLEKLKGRAKRAFYLRIFREFCIIFALVPVLAIASLIFSLRSCGYSMYDAFIVALGFSGAYIDPIAAFFAMRIFQNLRICLSLILMGAGMFAIAFNMVINYNWV